ncbi:MULTISPECIES: thioredoxin family protein [unclassified Prochlorococcus]|uniref:thioredoxin family protein n=1 Tax=unclassified Prochlorococcus TaxID=2627481 RepID=UPI001267D97E|nr:MULTISPECIES: thioredoxin family protein [unclassified Prochlorococcus]
MLSVIKYSSEDCGTCHRMSHYDASVTIEMNLEFIDVPMQDTNQYRKYRRILISKYPNKEGMGWPTYLIVEEPLADFKIIGEIKGGMSKGEFRENLNDIINTSNL